MTKVSLITLTRNRHNDWVKVYNEGRQNLSGFVPIHPKELAVMIRNRQCAQEDMYLALQGKRAIAVARYLEDTDSRMSFIADLTSLPNMNFGVEALVEFLLERARENGSTGLTSWTFMAQVYIPDILSKFTFNSRRVRYELLVDLNQTRVKRTLGDTQVRKCNFKKSSLEFLALNGQAYNRPLDVFELRDEILNDWRPRFLGFCDASDGYLMVASRSNSKRKEGRIDMTHLATSLVNQHDLLSGLIHDLVVSLCKDGVRQVSLEIDAGTDLKQSLIDYGFEVRRTLLEMCLGLMQD